MKFFKILSIGEKRKKEERDKIISAPSGDLNIGDMYKPQPPQPLDQRKQQLLQHKIGMQEKENTRAFWLLLLFGALGFYLAIFQSDDKIKALGGGFAGSVLGAFIQKMNKSDEIKAD